MQNPNSSPWGNQNKNDLDPVIKFIKDKLSRFSGGKTPGGLFIALVIGAAILLAWLASGIVIVDPDETAVVRRFGKMGRTMTAGIYYVIPWPIEKIDIVKDRQIRSMQLGFRSSDLSSGQSVRSVDAESLIITGDENLVNIHAIIQYRISNITDYLFKVWDPSGTPEGQTLHDAAETIIRGVIGTMNIDDVLTTGRAYIQQESLIELQELLDQYKTGLQIVAVKLQDVYPPDEVDAAFKDVVSAKEDRERIINEALAYREDLLPKALGTADKMILDAEAYKVTQIETAKGEAGRFKKLLESYEKSKSITRQRLYLEAMEDILSKIKNKTVVSGDLANGSLPLIHMQPDGGKVTTP